MGLLDTLKNFFKVTEQEETNSEATPAAAPQAEAQKPVEPVADNSEETE